jgi:hypothetical protein
MPRKKTYRPRTSSEAVQHHNTSIRRGMSRSPWADLWAVAMEEEGASDVDMQFIQE